MTAAGRRGSTQNIKIHKECLPELVMSKPLYLAFALFPVETKEAKATRAASTLNKLNYPQLKQILAVVDLESQRGRPVKYVNSSSCRSSLRVTLQYQRKNLGYQPSPCRRFYSSSTTSRKNPRTLVRGVEAVRMPLPSAAEIVTFSVTQVSKS